MTVLGTVLVLLGSTPTRASGSTPPIGWSQAPSLPAGFIPRWDFTSAYYPPSDQVVVFGGAPAQLGQGWYNDTWIYSAGAWTRGPAAPAGLTPRGGAAIAYDPVSQKLVMFGGAGPNDWPPRNETWLWNGSAWSPGPAAPSSLAGRTGAQMAYDDDLGKVVLFGGSGLLAYNDVWFYSGATNSWTQGPATPSAVSPRIFFGMTYDPGLHQIVVAGGDGDSDVWLFDGASWTAGPSLAPSGMANDLRERTILAYDPQLGGDVLFGGLGPAPAQRSVYFLANNTWMFIIQDDTNPPFSPPSGRIEGGLVFLPTKDAMMGFGGVVSVGDGTQTLADAYYFRDVAPQTPSATLDQTTPLQSSALTLSIASPTGGYYSLVRTIRWLKNGQVIPGANSTVLSPQYRPGDQIQAQVQYVDALGVVGPWVSSQVATVAQPAITMASGVPGTAAATTGLGFGALELVDINLDSITGTLLRKVTAGGTGGWGTGQTVMIPNPEVGGTHTVWAVGETTGSTASTTFQVLPKVSINPVTVSSGQSTTVTGLGFRASESVTASFPAGAPKAVTADANGSFTLTLSSPPEPYPSGVITATGPTSGSVTTGFAVKSVFTVGKSAAPGSIPVTLIGFSPSETVTFSIDGGSGQSFTTDSIGSLTATSTLITTWGRHTIKATGASSKVSVNASVNFLARMTITPTSGPKGTVVTIDSGPGWVPGGTVTLTYNTKPQQTLTADGTGSIHTTFTVSTGTVGVTYYFVLSDTVLKASVQKGFTVTG